MVHELVSVFVEKRHLNGGRSGRREGGYSWTDAFASKNISKIQRSLSASYCRGDYKIVVLQTLSGRHHTSAPCSVGTLFLMPASVEERQKGQQASEKQGKKTCSVHWNKVNNVTHAVRLTHMTLCRMSSALLSVFCSIVIRLRCRVSLKDPNKNLEAS